MLKLNLMNLTKRLAEESYERELLKFYGYVKESARGNDIAYITPWMECDENMSESKLLDFISTLENNNHIIVSQKPNTKILKEYHENHPGEFDFYELNILPSFYNYMELLDKKITAAKKRRRRKKVQYKEETRELIYGDKRFLVNGYKKQVFCEFVFFNRSQPIMGYDIFDKRDVINRDRTAYDTARALNKEIKKNFHLCDFFQASLSQVSISLKYR